jgi:nucleoside-diphosphate-sugar epimerase
MRTVIARPDAFQEIHLGPLGRFDIRAGKVAVFGKGDTKRRYVGVADVAGLVIALALEPDPPSVVEFGGSELLSRNEAIAVAERLTGHRMKRQRKPRSVARLGLRLLDRPNDALASVFGAGLHQDLVEADWDDAPLRTRGISARSASAWLEVQAKA